VHQVSDWGSGVAIKMGRRQGGASRTGTKKEHIWMLYVTKEQRSRRPIFIATLRAARLLAGCPAAAGSLIGQRPQRVFSL
jgi:hypothetical protein